MANNPRAARYNIRPVHSPAPPDEGNAGVGQFRENKCGPAASAFRPKEEHLAPDLAVDQGACSMPDIGVTGPAHQDLALSEVTEPRRSAAQQPAVKADTPEEIEAALATIAAERLSGRHLRRAIQIAQVHGITAKSEFDAVRLLREAEIDPFSLVSLVRVDSSQPEAGPALRKGGDSPPRAAALEVARLPGDTVELPKRTKPAGVHSTIQRAEANQVAEILQLHHDIARQRRRRLALLAARMFAFVLLPTIIVGWYFNVAATPMYSVRSELLIQKAGPASSGGSLSELFSGSAFATSQDSIAVQDYLRSREAMVRLEADLGFRSHFQSEGIDVLQRLEPNATQEAAYKVYKKFIKVSLNTNDGVILLEVIAADPDVAADWSRQLITYAEGQVDDLTQRLRQDQMRDAQEGYDEAQVALTASQHHLIELQQRYKIIAPESEVGMIVGQIGGLEIQITEERLSLAQMESNREPNQARMEPVKRRIATLEAQVAELRARLTANSTSETGLAVIQGELLVAEDELLIRELLLAQALQSMETARVEANRQVRYLSLVVSPIPPDEPTYPRAFDNTAVAMLSFLGIYLILSMTVATLREQTSS